MDDFAWVLASPKENLNMALGDHHYCGLTPDLPDKKGGEVVGDPDDRLAHILHGILRGAFQVYFPETSKAAPSRVVLVAPKEARPELQSQLAAYDWKFWEDTIVPLLRRLRFSRRWGINLADERLILLGQIRANVGILKTSP